MSSRDTDRCLSFVRREYIFEMLMKCTVASRMRAVAPLWAESCLVFIFLPWWTYCSVALERWKTAERGLYSCVSLHQLGSRLGGTGPGKWNNNSFYKSILRGESWLCDMWARGQHTGCGTTRFKTLGNFKMTKWQNLTHAKETIKLLFMYIMIHKLDLYINIAFHPNNQKYYAFN